MNIFGLVIQTRKAQHKEFDELVEAKIKHREEHIAQLVSDTQGLRSRAMDSELKLQSAERVVKRLDNQVLGKDIALRIAIKLLRENSCPESQMGRLQRLLMTRVKGTELLPHELGHPVFDDATPEQRQQWNDAQKPYNEFSDGGVTHGKVDCISGYKQDTVRLGNLA